MEKRTKDAKPHAPDKRKRPPKPERKPFDYEALLAYDPILSGDGGQLSQAMTNENGEVTILVTMMFIPSIETIPQSESDILGWGVTMKETSINPIGEPKRKLKTEGGTLIEITRLEEYTAECKIWQNKSWQGPFSISLVDVLRFDGTRADVEAQSVVDLCYYYKLLYAAELRKKELTDIELQKNPHYLELRETGIAYRELEHRVKELTAQRDKATGAKRNKIADELRSLEVENTRLSKCLKETTEKYEKWKAANPINIDIEGDSIISRINEKLESVKPRIEGFGI